MKIVLVALYDIHSYAIRILHSVLKNAGHEVYSVFFKTSYAEQRCTDFEKAFLIDSINNLYPGIVGFSLRSQFFPLFKDLSPLIKAHVMAGGHHCSVKPSQCRGYADSVCVGEGETAVLKNLGRTGVWDQEPLIQNLDTVPFRYYGNDDLYVFSHPEKDPKISILTTRGCFFDCSFCYNGVYKKICKGMGQYVRRRSVANVIEEIQLMTHRFPSVKEITFSDNVFTHDKEWLSEFAEKFRPLGLTFRCFGHFKFIDKEMLQLLKVANCHMITLGVQVGSQTVRLKDLNIPITNDEIIAGSTLIAHSGIRVRYDFLGNIPGGDNEKLIGLLAKPFTVRTFPLFHNPETPLTKKLLSLGVITQNEVEGNCSTSYKKWADYATY